MTSTIDASGLRRATRDTQQPIVGGVAGGLASHLGLPAFWVRAAFVVTAVLGGFGVFFYAGLWLVLPGDSGFEQSSPGLASATRGGRRPGRMRHLADNGPAIALGVLGMGVLLAFEAWVGRGAVFWPVLLAVVGIGLLWRQADEAQRERWIDASGRINPARAVFGSGGWASYVRVASGLVLLLSAIALFAWGLGPVGNLRGILVTAVVAVLGLALTVGPWIHQLATDLSAERAERVRSQERADLAAHLHDSVLQTLALIQKNADDGPTVARLARSQERDLRTWLFSDAKPSDTTVAGALQALVAELEDRYGVPVELVSVGDAPYDESLAPVVSATREAVTNAARHSGAALVDVYAEVSDAVVEVFVRDRGRGFDPEQVPDDRQGVRNSIVERMARHGGRAEIRSDPGDGTEVRLRLPRNESRPETRQEKTP